MMDSTTIVNPVKLKLAAGEPVLLMSLRQLHTPDAAMIVRECGFDGFYVDNEHGMLSWAQTSALCASALLAGLMPAVRVRANSPADIGAALDGGALCVIVPHVSSAEEAQAAVHGAKYPPLGGRSLAAQSPATRYLPLPAAEIVRIMNGETMVIAMLETAEGIAAADEIAAVPGIDALMIGPSDFSAELGIPGETSHPRIKEAYAQAIAAAMRHGKQFVASGPDIGELAAGGARILLGGTDVSYLMTAARQAAAALRKKAAL
jgi:4-hydroxy-2-oxoheptanedioate aldolase